MLISSPSRKRSRDVEDEVDVSYQPMGKRTRQLESLSDSMAQSPPSNSYGLFAVQNDQTGPGASNMNDIDMEMDQTPSIPPVIRSPQPSTSGWTLRPTPTRSALRASGSQPSARIPTPIVSNPVRPKCVPLQTSWSPSSPSRMRTKATDSVPRSALSTMSDRLPSPVDEDEPHTPTTLTGSQLSMLSVSDMEIDGEGESDVATPGATDSESVVVRKQRQRSGAFISTPEAARKFSMGYRDDCEKCRNRVPGHMNHFLGA